MKTTSSTSLNTGNTFFIDEHPAQPKVKISPYSCSLYAVLEQCLASTLVTRCDGLFDIFSRAHWLISLLTVNARLNSLPMRSRFCPAWFTSSSHSPIQPTLDRAKSSTSNRGFSIASCRVKTWFDQPDCELHWCNARPRPQSQPLVFAHSLSSAQLCANRWCDTTTRHASRLKEPGLGRIEQLRGYKERLVVFPHKASKPKEGDSSVRCFLI